MLTMLDTYCKAGGCTKGYQDAGFYVVGVDVEDQPNYCGNEFHKGDAIEFIRKYGTQFDAIHASPPCQRYSAMQHMHNNRENHPDLIDPTRQILLKVGKPFIIENVVGAPLRIDLMLCGTMFGLRIAKHRIFEFNFPFPPFTLCCNHTNIYDCYHGGEAARHEREKLSNIMNINWFMTREELRNAIPPMYTKYIGDNLIAYINKR